MTDATNRPADDLGAAGGTPGMPTEGSGPAGANPYTTGSSGTEGYNATGATTGTGSYGTGSGGSYDATSTGSTGGYGSSGSDSGSGMKDQAKDEAKDVAAKAGQSAAEVKDTAKEKVADVAGTAKEKATETVHEAKNQVRELYSRSRDELSQQAGSQQTKLAGGLRSLSGELGSMASNAQEPGMASDLVRQVSSYADKAGNWLESREPADVLDEVGRYARRHPGTFMLIAAGVGLLAGRVARAMKDSSGDDSQDVSGYGRADYYSSPSSTSSLYGAGTRAGAPLPTTSYPAGTTGTTGGTYSADGTTGATWAPVTGTSVDEGSTGTTYGSGGQR